MSTSTRSTARQPAGLPVGGQFATTRRGRPGVVLENYSDEVRDGEVISDREAAVILDQAQRSGQFWAGRFAHSVDGAADDAASAAMLAYLEQRARVDQCDAGGEDDGQLTVDASDGQLTVDANGGRVMDNVRAYMHRTVLTKTVQVVADERGWVRNRDASALRVFDQRLNELAVELRRDPTMRERDALAEQVRGTFPEKLRPRKNFHALRGFARNVSLDGDALRALADDAASDPRNQEAPELDTDTVPGSYRDQAEQVMAGGGRGAQLSAKSLAWSLMAERLDGPHPVKGSISEYSAAKVRRIVRAGGGAVAVARAVRSGDATAEQAEALFKPFGEIDDVQRTAALHIITNHPGYGDDLWDASVLAATNLLDRKK